MTLPIHRPEVIDYGPAAVHDMACAVCWEEKAVLDITERIFEPCWSCQRKGFHVGFTSPRRTSVTDKSDLLFQAGALAFLFLAAAFTPWLLVGTALCLLGLYHD